MLPLHALELLAPARDADTGIAAIEHGADAVYIGGPSFGARQAAGNSLDDIARLCDYAHRWNARVFMALNTLFRDDEIEAARSLAFDAKKAGVDVLILQDMGLLMGPLPDIEIHASTQCDIRTPEKAAFLEKVGFSQLVLARELDLDAIRAVRSALTKARIEFFVHGALCVSYSGQCYMSEAMLGRSANRGACAQLCRLPYDVSTEDGTVLAQRSHILSLKDNDQRSNLEALIDAGVSSFKIEGRLKDVQYVKNITALYRKEIDAILARRPELCRSSAGETTFRFTPDAAKTFRRGATDYFVHGRDFSKPYDLAQTESPKNTGDPVARVLRIDPKRLLVDALPGVSLANGDGLTYEAADEEIHGLSVNRAEREGNHWALYPRERTSQLDGLRTGSILSRNRDQAFEKILSGKTAERRIPVTATFTVEEDALTLLLTDGTSTGFAEVAMDLEAPSDAEENRARLAQNLGKMGDTDYRIAELFIPEDLDVFVPASIANQLRRHATAELDADRKAHWAPRSRRSDGSLSGKDRRLSRERRKPSRQGFLRTARRNGDGARLRDSARSQGGSHDLPPLRARAARPLSEDAQVLPRTPQDDGPKALPTRTAPSQEFRGRSLPRGIPLRRKALLHDDHVALGASDAPSGGHGLRRREVGTQHRCETRRQPLGKALLRAPGFGAFGRKTIV